MGVTAVFPLSPADGEALAAIVAGAVRANLADLPVDGRVPRSRALRALGSSFVTLERAGSLRGCVGTLDGGRPLYRDASRNAVRAMADPRVPPVTRDEWPDLAVSVSVLSPPEPLAARRLADLYEELRPKVDGLILVVGARQATFLPTVWRKLSDPADFVRALLHKGGWPDDELPEGARALRYTADSFHDHEAHEPL
jgi:AmmeMemoRadiSam system protein A